MSDLPDIEAVLREVEAELRMCRDGPSHIANLHARTLKAITDLQARVTAAEESRDHWMREAQLYLKNGQECLDQLTASQAEVARLNRVIVSKDAMWEADYQITQESLIAIATLRALAEPATQEPQP